MIVVVDQSGSVLESAIFSAVMASIFAELPAVKTSLVLFDTQVVDLSDKGGQRVDVLLSIQLGGGTDITQALAYANTLVCQPLRLIGLGALGYDARSAYNKATAVKLRKVGMDVLVCSPEKLAECVAEIVRG